MNALTRKKLDNCTNLANLMYKMAIRVLYVGGRIVVLEKDARLAVFSTFQEYDAFLAGIGVGERAGETKSCRSFSVSEWTAYQQGLVVGEKLRKERS